MHPVVRSSARTVVRTANTPFARKRLTRVLAEAPRPVRLEIGGRAAREGWVVTNVDALTRNYLDATSRWPLEDGAVSHVYSDNVIEHIPLDGARTMFAEAHRCLQPGGVIRVVTPDIRTHVEMYLAGPSAVAEPAARYYRQIGLTVEHPIDLIRIPIASFGHHTGYLWDFETLTSELTRAGFADITRHLLGSSPHPEFGGLDVRDNAEAAVQIAVEATR